MYDVIIVGAGIAGLTSAIYLKRANKKVLILEKLTCGGQIINAPSIENYPGEENISGVDLINNITNQVKDVEIKYEEVINITKNKEVKTNKGIYKAKSIIIATGAKNKNLKLPNEKELIGKGISYCASCDGAFYKNKIVMVVGGGNTALESALYLSDIASKVYLVHRRDEFRANETTINKVKEKDNIEIIYNSNITKIIGKEKLEKVEINNKEVEVNGLFVTIGKEPDTNSFDIINTNKTGYIETSENCHTNIEGIFAAGDVRSKNLRQLITAASDGAIAANEAIIYLKK